MYKTVQSASVINKCAVVKEYKTPAQIVNNKSTTNKRKGRKRRRSGWHRKNKYNLKRHKLSHFNIEDTEPVLTEKKISKGCIQTWSNTYQTILAWQYQRQAAFWKAHSSDLEKQNEELKCELENIKLKLMNQQSNEHLSATNITLDIGEQENKMDFSSMSNNFINKNIKILENEIQNNFDKYIEDNKPLYWPNIPLNFNFSTNC